MIYCVEDDAAICNMMVYTLNAANFEALGFSNSKDLYEAIKKAQPQLIILDIMLPGEDGLSILKNLKKQQSTRNIPIIMASAKGSEYDKVFGLDLGADDYLAKPFGMMEMISRVKAVLRRTLQADASSILSVGKLEMNLVEHIVCVDNEPIELTLKEYELLYLFMQNLGKVFTRDQLLYQIWHEDYLGETRTVDVHVNTLRTKLMICKDYIKTVRGVGYKMEKLV